MIIKYIININLIYMSLIFFNTYFVVNYFIFVFIIIKNVFLFNVCAIPNPEGNERDRSLLLPSEFFNLFNQPFI